MMIETVFSQSCQGKFMLYARKHVAGFGFWSAFFFKQ